MNDVRLIDANELKRVFSTDMRIINFDGTQMGAGGFLVQRYQVVGLIDEAPTIDAAPVVHARWVSIPIPSRYGGCVVECSKCYNRGNRNFSFCPSCGAKMDGGATNED